MDIFLHGNISSVPKAHGEAIHIVLNGFAQKQERIYFLDTYLEENRTKFIAQMDSIFTEIGYENNFGVNSYHKMLTSAAQIDQCTIINSKEWNLLIRFFGLYGLLDKLEFVQIKRVGKLSVFDKILFLELQRKYGHKVRLRAKFWYLSWLIKSFFFELLDLFKASATIYLSAFNNIREKKWNEDRHPQIKDYIVYSFTPDLVDGIIQNQCLGDIRRLLVRHKEVTFLYGYSQKWDSWQRARSLMEISENGENHIFIEMFVDLLQILLFPLIVLFQFPVMLSRFFKRPRILRNGYVSGALFLIYFRSLSGALFAHHLYFVFGLVNLQKLNAKKAKGIFILREGQVYENLFLGIFASNATNVINFFSQPIRQWDIRYVGRENWYGKNIRPKVKSLFQSTLLAKEGNEVFGEKNAVSIGTPFQRVTIPKNIPTYNIKGRTLVFLPYDTSEALIMIANIRKKKDDSELIFSIKFHPDHTKSFRNKVGDAFPVVSDFDPNFFEVFLCPDSSSVSSVVFSAGKVPFLWRPEGILNRSAFPESSGVVMFSSLDEISQISIDEKRMKNMLARLRQLEVAPFRENKFLEILKNDF